MLEHELYNIVGKEYNAVCIRLNPESAIFKGHFPGNPITPGVCRVGIVEELVRTCFGKDVRLVEIKNLKFMDVLRPELSVEPVVVFEKMEEMDNRLSVRGRVTVEEKVFTKYSLVFETI